MLYLIFPCRDEHYLLEGGLADYVSLFKNKGYNYSILVCLSRCSKDYLRKFRRKYRSLLRHRDQAVRIIETNYGKHGAIYHGMQECLKMGADDNSYIGFVDADGFLTLDSFVELFEFTLAQNMGMVVGTKHSKASREILSQDERQILYSTKNKTLSCLVNELYRFLYPRLASAAVNDIECGVKIMNAHAAKAYCQRLSTLRGPNLPRLLINPYFDGDLVDTVLSHSFTIGEYPISYQMAIKPNTDYEPLLDKKNYPTALFDVVTEVLKYYIATNITFDENFDDRHYVDLLGKVFSQDAIHHFISEFFS